MAGGGDKSSGRDSCTTSKTFWGRRRSDGRGKKPEEKIFNARAIIGRGGKRSSTTSGGNRCWNSRLNSGRRGEEAKKKVLYGWISRNSIMGRGKVGINTQSRGSIAKGGSRNRSGSTVLSIVISCIIITKIIFKILKITG
jgi:hypothetical protein